MNEENKHIVPIELLSKYLANEASEAERAQLEQWRNANNNNLKEYHAFVKLWNKSESANQNPDIDLEFEWQRMEQTMASKMGRSISFMRILQVAASIIVLVGLGFLLLHQTQTIATKSAVAQVQIINLPDGSKVTLNANSKLIYSKNFGKSDRKVTLKGEAFFEVTKNAEKPFVINAQGASIKVLGTKFNVKAYKDQDEVNVTVVEGVVQLFESKTPLKATLLNAGESGVYFKREKTIKKILQINANDIAWKTQKMVFENSTLLQVVEVLTSTYHVKFKVSDKVKNCTITVEFDQKKLASVLKVLKSTLNLKITKHNDVILIDGDGCGQ